ncbi:glycosyl hydrolase family 31 [Aphanothece hegewaldii CCALA 016]|uniref:Glycosyl hydrolase family 31 n=1 Tax=Aphanothece hegewaldii CCALA 016 TaxID=2107694 RepID=A0A2T1LS94_9CHRO|nr:glycosyl hydrolase family 31 [Aphanothece hegewaldii]PSF32477.1 glycosyl hydrolase family 31 [Aphanothece hegewaldii CCALA 016]
MLQTFWAVIKNSKIELVDLVIAFLKLNSIGFGKQTPTVWNDITLSGLNNAYDENEPEYSLESIKEFNPEYEGK